jgi:hypothetical protein
VTSQVQVSAIGTISGKSPTLNRSNRRHTPSTERWAIGSRSILITFIGDRHPRDSKTAKYHPQNTSPRSSGGNDISSAPSHRPSFVALSPASSNSSWCSGSGASCYQCAPQSNLRLCLWGSGGVAAVEVEAAVLGIKDFREHAAAQCLSRSLPK